MILVDSSIWAESSNKKRQDIISEMEKLGRSHRVLGHELIFLELTLGEATEIRKRLLSAYAKLPYAVPTSTFAVLEFVRRNDLTHKGIGAIDAHLLASVYHAKAQLWTLDTNLRMAATTLKCAYEVTP